MTKVSIEITLKHFSLHKCVSVYSTVHLNHFSKTRIEVIMTFNKDDLKSIQFFILFEHAVDKMLRLKSPNQYIYF